MRGKLRTGLALAGALALAAPAAAQFSAGYDFIQAVKSRDGQKATDALNNSSQHVIDSTDANGDTALHIVARRHDLDWLTFMLSKGARIDARNRAGETALLLAARGGFVEGARLLLGQRAEVNAADDHGETPLIVAVHARDLEMVRLLVDTGADPHQPDHIAGKSARDYALADPRAATLLKVLDQAKPAAVKADLIGPVR